MTHEVMPDRGLFRECRGRGPDHHPRPHLPRVSREHLDIEVLRDCNRDRGLARRGRSDDGDDAPFGDRGQLAAAAA